MIRPGLLLCVLAPTILSAATTTGQIDVAMSEWSKPDSPGCAVGLVQDGSLALAKGYGMADLERDVPITPRTVFEIASTSKQITAAVIVLLAQAGKLSLDDDVRRYVPELPQYGAPITIRHLLNHTSGLRDYTDLLLLAGWNVDDWTTADQALAILVRQKELNFTPGARYLYSNSGYFLLSAVAARAGDKPFPDLARDLVFAPLGMTRTHVHQDHRMVVKDRALGYARSGDRWTLDLSAWEQTGDGAVYTTVEDLARWAANFDDPKVGGQALLDEIQRKGRLGTGEEISYAEGLRHGTYRGLATVGHGGSWAGYRSSLLRFPSERTTVLVLCNAEGAQAVAIARRLADIVLSARLTPAADAPDKPTVTLNETQLDAWVGPWRDVETHDILRIFREGGALAAYAPDGVVYALAPRSDTVFTLTGTPAEVAFDPATQRMTVTQPGAKKTSERVKPVTMGPADRSALAGRYRSDELDVEFRVEAAQEGLVLHMRGREATLVPTSGDEMVVQPTEPLALTLRLLRDARNQVTGFQLSSLETRNLRFTRVR
jgi:CubicO group peptidase (beta-lactamase class C family)